MISISQRQRSLDFSPRDAIRHKKIAIFTCNNVICDLEIILIVLGGSRYCHVTMTLTLDNELNRMKLTL